MKYSDETWWSPAHTGDTLEVELTVGKDGTLACDTLHIFQNHTGRFTYAGDIPLQLGELDESKDDGSWIFPTFKTPLDAFMYARRKGYTSTTYLAVSRECRFYATAAICRDETSGKLYLPFLKEEKHRCGKIERLDYKRANEYKALGLEDMIFWSVYETGMDSIASLISDFATEDEALSCRAKLYQKLSN